MRWNGEFWGTTSNTAGAHGEGLTLAKLEAAIRSIPKPPPPVKVDLYGHDLGPDSDGKERMFELGEEAFRLVGEKRERRFLIVPNARLDSIAYELRKMGADVRIRPQIGAPESENDG